MGWAFCVRCISAISLIAIPFVLANIRQCRRQLWPWLTIIVALTPLPLSMGMLHVASWVKGFTLVPQAAMRVTPSCDAVTGPLADGLPDMPQERSSPASERRRIVAPGVSRG